MMFSSELARLSAEALDAMTRQVMHRFEEVTRASELLQATVMGTRGQLAALHAEYRRRLATKLQHTAAAPEAPMTPCEHCGKQNPTHIYKGGIFRSPHFVLTPTGEWDVCPGSHQKVGQLTDTYDGAARVQADEKIAGAGASDILEVDESER